MTKKLGAAVTKKVQPTSAHLQNFWAPDKTASANGISTLSTTMVIQQKFLQYLFASSQVICSAHLSIRNSTQCVFLNHGQYVRFSSKGPKGRGINTRQIWKDSAAVYGVVLAHRNGSEGRRATWLVPVKDQSFLVPPLEVLNVQRHWCQASFNREWISWGRPFVLHQGKSRTSPIGPSPIGKSRTSQSCRLGLRRSEKCSGCASLASLPILFT